jgi:hypothetical protein
MSDDNRWIQLLPLITGGLGYLGGIFSEPIKSWLKRRQERAALRESIYTEIWHNMYTIEQEMEKAQRDKQHFERVSNPFLRFFAFECYDYACRNTPILLNALPEAITIRLIYDVFKDLADKKDPELLLAYTQETHFQLIQVITSLTLDPFLLRDVRSKHTQVLPWYRQIILKVKYIPRRLFKQPSLVQLGDLSTYHQRGRPIDELARKRNQDIIETLSGQKKPEPPAIPQ